MKIKTQIFVLSFIIMSVFPSIIVINQRSNEQKLRIEAIDENLKAAAIMAREIVGDDYHDNIVDNTSIDPEEFDRIVDKFNKICIDTDIQYLWSLLSIGDDFVFTTSTSPDHIVENQAHAKFFEYHSNPEAYRNVISSDDPEYTTITDKWGSIRSVLIPFKDSLDRSYLFGAAIDISDLQQQLDQYNLALLLQIFLILGISLFLSVFLASFISRSFQNLQDGIEELKQGNFEYKIKESKVASYEERKLIDKFNSMREGILQNNRISKELEKIQRLESLGLLAGGIAHDFNNLMTSLFGNITLAQLNLQEDDPAYISLEEAISIMPRVKSLTQQLLTFAKGGVPKKEVITNIEGVVMNCVKFDLSGSNITVVFNSHPNLWPVNIDKGQIEQVISNITINALQSMKNGGILRINLENSSMPNDSSLNSTSSKAQSQFNPDTSAITSTGSDVSNFKSGKYIKITFEDEGVGISEENLQKIFDPFFTTKTKGSGLGLATVFSIIKKHEGYIDVKSKLKEGTTIDIFLPVDRDLVISDINEQSLQQSNNKLSNIENSPVKHSKDLRISDTEDEKRRILILDDEIPILDFLEEALKKHNIHVSKATTGEEAISLYQQSCFSSKDQNSTRKSAYDIVLLDLTIPGGSGGQGICEKILKINPTAKCIVFSGYADDPIIANYADYGFKAAISKPFNVNEMISLIENLMNSQSE